MHAGAKSTSSSAGLFRAQAQQTGQRKPSNLVQPPVHMLSKGANTEAKGGESSNASGWRMVPVPRVRTEPTRGLNLHRGYTGMMEKKLETTT